MIQPTEVFQLLMGVVLAPLIVRSLFPARLPGAHSIAIAISAMAFAYVFTVLEGFTAPELFNTLEHAMYAVAGGAFLTSSIQGMRFWHYRGSDGS